MARRRMLYGREELIELPDYFRVDFTTTEDNTELYFGYYALAAGSLADLILDSVSNKNLAVNGADAYVKIPTAGNHILYVKITLPFSNNNYFVKYPSVLNGKGSVSYFRIPYTYTANLGSDSTHLCKIPYIDNLRNYPQWGPGYTHQVQSLVRYRVPIGCKEHYNTTSSGNIWPAFYAKMEEYDFKYKTS